MSKLYESLQEIILILPSHNINDSEKKKEKKNYVTNRIHIWDLPFTRLVLYQLS